MLLRSLDPKKAKVMDGIPAQFLLACPLSMAKLGAPLLNKSLHSSSYTFPALWKRAIVSPVQKSSQSSDLINFHPISVLSKMLERVVHQLMAHLNKFNLLSVCQFGFRSCYSTQDVLLCVTESWRKAIDEGMYMYTGAI